MEKAGAIGFVLILFLFFIGLSNDIGRITSGEGFGPAIAFLSGSSSRGEEKLVEVTTSERYARGGELGELPAQNLIKAFYMTVDRLGDDLAIRTQDDSYSISWNELRERVHRIAGGLAKLGVTKGDTVALMLNNRPEFIPCDLAAVALGGIPFSIYQTSSPEQIQYVCSDSESKVAIVETMFLEQFEKAREDLPEIEHVIVVDGDGGTHTLAEVEEMDPGFDPARSSTSSQPDDMLTLIYTSGTTGPPKGVQLTHRNLMAPGRAASRTSSTFPERGGKVISWLPAAHIAERGAHYYLPINRGRHRDDLPRPAQDRRVAGRGAPDVVLRRAAHLREDQGRASRRRSPRFPTSSASRPRQGIAAAIKKVRLEQAGEEVPEELAAGVAQADEALFAHAPRSSSGSTSWSPCNVGAAPTPVEVLEFFHAIGVPIGELWGMSETCGVATCNPPDKVKIGTVGPARSRASRSSSPRTARCWSRRRRSCPATATCPRRTPRPSTTTAGC